MVKPYLSSVVLLLTATIPQGHANPAYNRPNSRSPAGLNFTENGCGVECQEAVAKGTAAGRAIFGDVPFDEAFYTTAANFSPEHSKPGDLLKLEPYTTGISLSLYPDLGHSAKPSDSSFGRLDWLRERFEGKPLAGRCEMRDYCAVDAATAHLPLDAGS